MFIGHDDSSLGIENQGQGLCPSPRLRRSPIVGWGRGPLSPFRTLAHRASPLFKTFRRPWAKRQARKMTTIIRPLDSAYRRVIFVIMPVNLGLDSMTQTPLQLH